ncbi:hypothetical protein LMG28614_03783 [Paraburkholderia ultramafica]|uniref:Uncharacterized protein n=1 Tax=Paraburkholderia ultramafica TaxID=1544867 RepID=A0A6S7BJX7_9BURK|nr:hypothetical protein LMG28614_03783 [Paraburkholderia ultramafica]
MNFKLLLLVPLFFMAASIWADEEKAGKVIAHEMSLDGCHFRMTNPYDGTLTRTSDGGDLRLQTTKLKLTLRFNSDSGLRFNLDAITTSA